MPQNECPEGALTDKEQVAAVSCCTSWRPWLRGVCHEARFVVFYLPNCGSWSCPYCAQNNARLWSWRITEAAAAQLQSGSAISFTTLTSHERLNAAGSIAVFKKAWPQLRKRAQRAAGGGDYVQVPERHASGRLHVHMLDTFNLPRKWWATNSRECGLGYQVETEFARTAGGAARYAAKYLAKQFGTSWPRGFRRVRMSPGFREGIVEEELRPDETLSQSQFIWGWHLADKSAPIPVQLQEWRAAGYNAVVVEAGDLSAVINGEAPSGFTDRGASV